MSRSGSGRTSGRGGRGSGCRCWTTSTWRWRTPTPIRRRSSRASEAVRDQALDVLARLGFPRRDDVGAPFDPARHEAVAAVLTPDAAAGHGRARSCGPGYGEGERPAAARRGGGGQADDGAGLMAAARDFYEVLGVPRTRRRRRSSAPTASWPATYHPDVNKDPGAEERFKEIIRGVRRAVRSRDPAPVRRVRRRLPPGAARTSTRRPGPARARRRRRAAAGRRPGRGGGPAGSSGFGRGDIDLEDLLGGMFGGRARRRLGADPRRRPGGRARAHRRGGLPRRPALDHAARAGGRAGYDVTIPAGVTDGQRIRLAGQGGRGSDGAAAGRPVPGRADRAAPPVPGGRPRHHVDLPLAPWEAALGATVAGRHARRRGQGRGARRARRAGGGCGCAAAACRTRAARRRPVRRGAGSWCRRS